MSRLRTLAGAIVIAGSLSCSTVDRGPVDQCEDDIDCGDDAVCSLAQGNICVAAQPPPQTALGFDIQEGELRIELTGCDPEVSRQVQGTELRVQKHDALIRSYSLYANEVQSVLNCGGSSCEGGICDEDALTCTKPSDALLGLTMPSRLGLADLASPQKSYTTVTDPPLPEGVLPSPVEFIWPSYDVDTLAAPDVSADKAHAAVRLRVTPPLEATTRSQYQRVIASDAPDDLETSAVVRCQRAIFGNEGTVRTIGGTPISAANVEFNYNEPIATNATVLGGVGATCVETQDCLPGWACNEDGRCGLDLSGVSAGSSTSIEDPPGALAPAYLHTYCEGIVAPVDPLIRQFRVSVTPPADSGLPNGIYSLAQGFLDPPQPGTLTEVNIEDAAGGDGLCLPDWQAPQPISFSLSGAPVTLAQIEDGDDYACCSTDCLPSTETEPTPPPKIDSCHNFDSVRFETRWINQELLTWASEGCIPTAVYSDGSSGGFVRIVSNECSDGKADCSVALTPGEADDLERMYTVSIVQPVGSVFRSQTFSVAIDPETSSFEPFTLEPRVLLRGTIACVGNKCSAENAIFAAERLRADTDSSDLPGPFYFQARVDETGSFVLPLDPGRYVVTAYPAVGQPGGPARFEVLDLREGSPMLTEVGGVLEAELSKPLELDDGVLVRVQLYDFDLSTRVTPLDTGSWTAQGDFPPDIDLNAPLACHGSSSRGCVIRRIRPTDTPIPLLLAGRFEFTARARGTDQCPG